MFDRSYIEWPFFDSAHAELQKKLEKFSQAELAKKFDQDEDRAAAALLSTICAAGLTRYCTSLHQPLDVRALCLIRENLARHSGLADFVFAMQGLGAGPISLFGSEEQKQSYLPAVENGRSVAAFALSEFNSGSDVAAIETTAILEGEHYVLNGSKAWISNAGLATFYVVFARTGEAPGARGLSAFILDASSKGFRVDQRTEITSPHPVGSLVFDHCRVPKANLLGTAGQGFKIAMATLDVFRSTVGAAALGFARRALKEAFEFASKRELFGKNLNEFQITQAKLADMAVEIDASALLIYRAAWAKDRGAERVTREAAMAKLYSTEAAQRVIDQALQILGGRGVVRDSVLERLYRDIRPLRIYEGTSEIQKLVIFNQLGAAK